MSDRFEEFLSAVENLVDDFRTVVNVVDGLHGSVGKRVQGRIRKSGTLHLQYGVQGNYKKADVTISHKEEDQILDAGELADLVGSLAGTDTKYLLGEDMDDGSIEIGGVTISSPFWSPQTAPSRNRNW